MPIKKEVAIFQRKAAKKGANFADTVSEVTNIVARKIDIARIILITVITMKKKQAIN